MDKLAKLILALLPVLLKKRMASRVPVVLEDAPEWGDEDRRNLAAFFKGSTGTKLKAILTHDMYEVAISGVKLSDFEQGVLAGKNRELGYILAHAEIEEA